VTIGTKRGKGWITLSPLPKQPESKHLPRVKTEVLCRWGVIGLLDILKEAAMLTGCLDCFQSTGSWEAILPDLLHKRLLLCLYGLGTNMGLKRMAGVDPKITAEDLRCTRRRYLHKEHILCPKGVDDSILSNPFADHTDSRTSFGMVFVCIYASAGEI
jgi:Tn3 transposase DDE domain